MQQRFSRRAAARLALSAIVLAGASFGPGPDAARTRRQRTHRRHPQGRRAASGRGQQPALAGAEHLGSGEPWMGSSWTLGKEFAKLLGVKMVPVQVSHETKVPALIANQMDIMIGPLNENAERAKIIDFVTFSSTSVCMFGLASNPKFTGVTKVEDFNRPEITMAYFSGAGEEPLVREQFSKASCAAWPTRARSRRSRKCWPAARTWRR